MGWQIVHYQSGMARGWGVVAGDRIIPSPGAYFSLADFLTNGGAAFARQVRLQEPSTQSIALNSITLLSPVTSPCRIIGQGTNYQSHRKESSLHPSFNLVFAKADSSLTTPSGPVLRPPGVQLLDYELEVGLVIGRSITQPIAADESWTSFVAGLVMANDVSARDVQIPEEQWFHGKSFRTFCPAGPYFYLLDQNDVQRLGELRLQLWVNEQLRQDALFSDVIYGPAVTLPLLSRVLDLAPGDLLLTGTPGGVALRAPSKFTQSVASLMSPRARMRAFISGQKKRASYLHDGDSVRSVITTPDHTIDLGEQVWKVVAAPM